MPSSLSAVRGRSVRLVVVLLVGLLAAGLLSSSARAETAAPGRVGGLVLDRNNQPLVGATVSLTDASGSVAGFSADDQGRWSLSVPQGDYDLAVSAQQGGHTLSAKVGGYTVGADTKLNLVLAGDPAGVRSAAAAAAGPGSAAEDAPPVYSRAAAAVTQSSETVRFSGRVLDPDGGPVRGNVSIGLRGAVSADVIAFEHDDGTFSLDVPAGTYTLRVETDADDPDDCPGSCPDYRSERQAHSFSVSNFHLDADRQETIRLPRPAVMTASVVDPSNRPVADAWVTSTSNWNEPLAIPLELFPGATVTDVSSDVDLLTGNDGTAAVEYFPGSGPSAISVEPPPGTQLPTETAVPLNATSLKIQVQDGPTLHGRILQADGTRLHFSDGYLSGETGWYPFAATAEGYAVTAPPGRYRISLEEANNEEGESSDYWIWGLTSDPFDLVDDQTLDLNVPLGKARLWVVDDQGHRLDDFDTYGFEASGEATIAGGIRATTRTDSEAWPDDEEYLAVIGPSLTAPEQLNGLEDYAGAPSSAYVAPGEHTIIAFTAGTGPGYASSPPTTTTTTQPTTTTTTNPDTPNDPRAGPAAQPGTSTGSGYWTLSSDGTVHRFGAATQLGNSASGAVDLEPTPSGKGYWTLNRTGSVQAFGDAVALGTVDTARLATGEAPASLSATPSGKGYWVFTNRGRAIAYGDAAFLGDVSALKLNGPVLGSVATPSGNGYYMVASDGGIFAFGDAAFIGSMGGKPLNAPVQSLVPDSDGKGYWLVASDGGIFAFDAPFRGSMGDTKLNKPVVGMVRYGDGYLMVGADGGIFNFSTSPFAGSLGDRPPASPVVAVAALPTS